MRVFVAGATGVLGRPLVGQLLERGHAVGAMTRSAESARRLRERGVEAVECDVYDGERLARVLAEARPEVVVHALTALPKRIDPRRVVRDVGPTNRIRTEGTDRLVAAARGAGARRLVAESVAFAYAPGAPDEAFDEDAPLVTEGPGAREVVGAVRHLERATLDAGMQGVVLRYGFLYGPGTIYAGPDGAMFVDARKRRLPVVGRGRGRFSFVCVDDAARATVRAVEGDIVGVFNVVEDEAPAAAEWIPAYARALGAKAPLRVPRWVGRLAAGAYGVHLMEELPGASNRRAREVLGWTPRRRWSDAPVLAHV